MSRGGERGLGVYRWNQIDCVLIFVGWWVHSSSLYCFLYLNVWKSLNIPLKTFSISTHLIYTWHYTSSIKKNIVHMYKYALTLQTAQRWNLDVYSTLQMFADTWVNFHRKCHWRQTNGRLPEFCFLNFFLFPQAPASPTLLAIQPILFLKNVKSFNVWTVSS